MADAPNFAKLVPGFDFLQGLVKNASATLPNIGQWVAPTLNPEELERRIGELRAVQFWLEQNAKMLAATIQALEVQRMTLSTLKTMNVQMEDLRESLQIRLPGVGATMTTTAPTAPPAAPATPKPAAAGSAPAAKPAAAIDPMQWWSALTQQFTQLAADAMKEAASDATTNLAATAVKRSLDSAGVAKANTPSSSSAPTTAAHKTAATPRKRAASRSKG